MRKLLGTVVVVLLLLGLSSAATAGVLWFQTADRNVKNRTGAGVLTVPRIGTEQIGDLVMWTPKRVLVSSEGAVRELTFRDRSIEDTLGAVVFLTSVFEDEEESLFAALVIWTPRRVLVASPDGSVDELLFEGESIESALGVLTLPAFDPEGPPILVIWTPRRVMLLRDAGLEELTFEGRSIRDALGAVLALLPTASGGGGIVVWTRKRVLVSSGGPAIEITHEGDSIEDTLGVLVQPPDPEGDGLGGLVIWTTDRLLNVSGGDVSEIAFDGEAIRSKVRADERSSRRQVETVFTSLYEAEARLNGTRGSLLVTNPLFESFLPQ